MPYEPTSLHILAIKRESVHRVMQAYRLDARRREHDLTSELLGGHALELNDAELALMANRERASGGSGETERL